MKSFFTFIVGMIFGMVALIGGIAGAGYWAFTNMTIAQVEELTGTEFPIYEDDPDGVKQMTFEQIVYYAMDVYASIDTYTIEELAAKMGIGGMLPQSIGAFNIDFLYSRTLGDLMGDGGILGILDNITVGDIFGELEGPLAALGDITIGTLMNDPFSVLDSLTLGDLITDIESTPLATLAGSTLGDLMSDPMGMLNTMTLGDLITDIESTPLASFASSTLGELMEDPMGMFETITFGELIDDIESTPLASLVDMTIGDLMIDPSTIMDSIISDLYLRDVLDINPATTSNLLQILAYRQFVGIAEDGVVYYEKTATEYELATITTGDSITLTDNIYVPLKVNDIGAKLQLLTLAESIGVTDSSSTMLKSIAYSQTLWNELIDLDADMQYYEKSGENFVIIDYADIELGDTIYEAVIISEVGDRIATLKMQDILDNPLSDPNAHPIMIKIYNANPGITELGAVMDTIISDLYIRDIIDIDPINTVNLLQILAYEQFTGIAEENAIYYEKTATEYVLISKTVGVTIIAADNIYVPLKVQDIGTKLGALTLSEAVGVNDDSCMIIKSMAYYEVSWSVLGDIDAGTQYFEKVSGNYIKLNYQDIEVGDVIYQELLISDMDTRASSLRISDLIGAPVVDVVSGKYEGVWAIFEVDDGLGGVTVLDPLLNNFAAAMTSAFNPNSLTCERLERISQIDMDLSAELEGKTVIEIIEDYNDFNAFLAENPAIAALYEDYISNP